MQSLHALDGLRIQGGFPNEEVAVRRYKKRQKFVDGVRNFELKRSVEKYVEEPPTVEALRFTVRQRLRMRGSARTDQYQASSQQLAPLQNQPNPVHHQNVPPPVHNAQQKPPQPKAYRLQLEGVSIAVCSRLPSEGSRTKTYATNN